MNIDAFRVALAASSLARHAGYVMPRVLPAFDLVHTAATSALGGSRFGGTPDLPASVGWPKSGRTKYRFLLQIDLAELGVPSPDLPPSGLLSVFAIHDPKGDAFAQDPHFVRAIYTPAGTSLAPTSAPPSVPVSRATAITFRTTLDIPYDEYQADAWPLRDDELDAYDALRRSLHTGRDQLLGYPAHASLAYDPRPGPEWVTLLTLASHRDLGWSWHDGGSLMIFIERSRLARSDFSALRADAG